MEEKIIEKKLNRICNKHYKSSDIYYLLLDEYHEEYSEIIKYNQDNIRDKTKEIIMPDSISATSNILKEKRAKLVEGFKDLAEVVDDLSLNRKLFERSNWVPSIKNSNEAYQNIKEIYEKWSKCKELNLIDKINYYCSREFIYNLKAEEIENSIINRKKI